MTRPTLSLRFRLTLGAVLAVVGSSVAAGAMLFVLNVDPVLFVPVLCASTIVVTLVVWWSAQRLVSTPLRTLADAVRDLSADDHTARLARPPSRELGGVVDHLNELLNRLDDQERHLRQQIEEQTAYAQGESFRLETAVAERTQHLLESKKQAEAERDSAETDRDHAVAAYQGQGLFLANLVHEIRTPMNGVTGMSELLFNTDLTPEQAKYTRAIWGSAEDLLSIINNLLDYSKIEAGKLEKVDSTPFSPTECVERVTGLLAARAQQRGISLSHECSDTVPPALLGDGKRLRQVLTNILGNALKFTERGTIVVRTTLVESTDDVSTLRFEVVDTGVGIPSHLHQHIFEGFSQASSSTTYQSQGTGLGLAISKHLVELMGGEIGLISKPGVGSNFWFTVKGEHRRPFTAADRDLTGVRALVVSADPHSRETLQQQLTGCHATSLAASNAAEVRALLQAASDKQDRMSVVIVDAPAEEGLALAREIDEAATTSSPPLILVSNIERNRTELREANVDDWVRKPVQEMELAACVARVTGRLEVTLPPDDDEQERVDETDIWETISGARLLVAEDNDVNRDVMMTMLGTLKCQADVVFNGADAVTAVQRDRYDLVILDCQMPVLDGYEATRQIRQLIAEGKVDTRGTRRQSNHLPVIAVTAHTAPADRARSLASGVDEFVSKPISLEGLRGVLKRWVGGQFDSDLPVAADQPRSASSADGPINEAALEQILELDRVSGGGFLARLARNFLAGAPTALDDLRTAIQEGDAARTAKVAHSLQSTCLSVGANGMADVSKKIETLGKTGTTEGTAELAAELDETLLAVRAALEARIHSTEEAPNDDPNASVLEKTTA